MSNLDNSEAQYFEVSASWMKATGQGDQPKVFLVTHTWPMPVRGEFMYDLLDESTGKTWTVWSIRGRLL